MSGGRPPKLTEETTKKLISAIIQGNHYDVACDYAGINYSTFRRWMIAGEDEKEGEFCEFCEAIKKAEAQAELRLIQKWQKLNDREDADWKSIATFLERRYPDKWGKKEKKTVDLNTTNFSIINDIPRPKENENNDTNTG